MNFFLHGYGDAGYRIGIIFRTVTKKFTTVCNWRLNIVHSPRSKILQHDKTGKKQESHASDPWNKVSNLSNHPKPNNKTLKSVEKQRPKYPHSKKTNSQAILKYQNITRPEPTKTKRHKIRAPTKTHKCAILKGTHTTYKKKVSRMCSDRRRKMYFRWKRASKALKSLSLLH